MFHDFTPWGSRHCGYGCPFQRFGGIARYVAQAVELRMELLHLHDLATAIHETSELDKQIRTTGCVVLSV